MFKNFIQKRLENYVKKYIKKQNPKIVLVTGSVGKTSTKLAIATVLSQKYRVRVHKGNHNTHMSVPLGILGIDYPENIRSITQWLKVRRAALQRIHEKVSDCDVIVQELGTDQPGDIAHFGSYIYGDIAVVTAVSPEHMEFFKTIDAVAEEELAVSLFARITAINRDDVSGEFAHFLQTPSIVTYGMGGISENRIQIADQSLQSASGVLLLSAMGEIDVSLRVASTSGVKAAAAAAWVGSRLGMTLEEIKQGLGEITAPAGRMNVLRGLNSSTIIDDTYNSSPLAVSSALSTLYGTDSPCRIAILGDMNELGESSAQEHKKIGELCTPDRLTWVVTIGAQSRQYLAPAAQAKGCQVKSFDDPISAGSFVHSVLEKGAVVLAKGSQNGVFAEEAVKILLHETEEEESLVRQTQGWLDKKHRQFEKFQ